MVWASSEGSGETTRNAGLHEPSANTLSPFLRDPAHGIYCTVAIFIYQCSKLYTNFIWNTSQLILTCTREMILILYGKGPSNLKLRV